MGESLSFIGQMLLAGFAVSVALVLFADDARHRRWVMAFGLACLVGFILYQTMGLFRMGVAALIGYWYWHLFWKSGGEGASTGSDPAIEAAVEQDALPGDVAGIRR